VIQLTGVAPIERAISTAGGISWDSINADYSLTSDPQHLRRRRNARLGGADRRLPAASLLRDRASRSAGRYCAHEVGCILMHRD
jgi:hypothetical protein